METNKFLDLMAKLRITAVYWVDDENAAGVELSLDKLLKSFISSLINAPTDEAKVAIGKFKAAENTRKNAQNILNILNRQDEDLESKSNRIEDELSKLLDKVENPAEALVESLRSLPGPLGQAERDALKALFSSGREVSWEWRPLSFTKWATEFRNTLQEHSPPAPTLFIVDLQNTSESSATDGSSVLSDLANAELDRKLCHLIVLTSECKKDKEFRKGRELTEKFFPPGQTRIPVFVISKNRFSADPQGMKSHMESAFISALERADLSIVHQEFAGIMRKYFQQSIEIAFNALDSMTIEELMFAVSHTSKKEGVSEIETLLRLMAIAQREGLQKAITESSDLRSIIMQLRDATLSPARNDLETDSEIVKLRCAELYDKPEVVNKLFSPVSPGDLFAIRRVIQKRDQDEATTLKLGDEELYVLAANACDLMLRSTGTRKLDNGILLRLNAPSEDENQKKFSFALPHLEFTNVANASTKQIELRNYTSIPLSLLDLCWTNSEGQCTWPPANKQELQEKLLASQLARFEILEQEYSELDIDNISSLAQPLRISHETRTEGNKLTYIKYEIRRVGRLSHTHAAQLTTRFTGVFGRPSEAHDFSHSLQ